MKLSPRVFFYYLGLCSLLLAWCSPTVAQGRPVVVSVSFHEGDAQTERVRIKLEGTHTPKVYAIAGEKPRLVVDFPGAGYAGLVTPLVKDDDTLVKDIRVGVHTKPAAMVRVVLDLQPGWKYTYSRDFIKEENVLNIVLVPVTQIKRSEAPIARIAADETKRMIVSETKKSVPSDVGQSASPPPAVKPAAEVAAAAEPVKTETAAPAPPPVPREEVKATKTPEEAPASPAPSKSGEIAAKAASAVTARPATEPQARKPVEPAETTGNEAATPPPVKEPAVEVAVSAPTTPAASRNSEITTKKQEPAPAPSAIPKPEETAAKIEQAVTAKAAAEPQAEKPAGPAGTPKIKEATPPPAAPPAAAEIALQPDPLLLDITYENSSSKGEMVFFRLNGFFPPNVSAVESDNPQVVCEFANTAEKGNIKPVIETKGAYVQKILTVSGKDPKKIQVTLQLTPGRDYDLRQVFFKEDNLFVLVVNTMDEENVDSPAENEKK